MRTSALVSVLICTVGVIVMSVRMTRVPLGPNPEIQVDTLKIRKAFWNKNSDGLILVRDGDWAAIDLGKASLTNKQFKYDALPEEGNSFTMSGFRTGSPSAAHLSGFVEIPMLTSEYASFAYKWNGEPWHDHTHRVEPPSPLGVGFYRSQGHYARDNRTFWGSYILVTPDQRSDGRWGVEIFYHPGLKTDFQWHAPRLFPLGPSLLAVCMLVYVLQVPLGLLGTSLVSVAAIALHLFSWLILLMFRSWGEAWSGQGPEHDQPLVFLVIGLGIIVPLVLVKYAVTVNKQT